MMALGIQVQIEERGMIEGGGAGSENALKYEYL